jgi:L-ascorbate metabolism protein UlaG (beta-lactamase superfamily)
MSQLTYRLAKTTAVEPLINSWAVWSDTIAPAPYSLHVQNYQIKTLGSFLSNPEVHVKACQSTKFTGGPFVNAPVERAAEIKALLESTKAAHTDNLAFASSVADFYDLLNREAKGQSLDPFYARLPEELRGYVELVYDYFNHPNMRFMESLLYHSPYYKESLQSLRLFTQKSDSARPFFLSTPRLLNPDEIDWRVPFAGRAVDDLFRLDLEPQPVGRIREILGLAAADEHRLMPLLAEGPQKVAPRWEGPGVRVRYFNHATVLVEGNGVSILTDPWIGIASEAGGAERLTYEDLPEKIDYALITHNHHDHFVLETLLRLRRRIGCLIVPRSFGMYYTDTSLKLMAQKVGIENVVELDSLDSVKLPDGEIISVPFLGEHADLAHGKAGYVIRLGRETMLFAADSNCLDARIYEHLRRIVGPMETVFLGMECVGAPLSWLYGALLPYKIQHAHDKSRRTRGSDSAAANAMLEAVGARRVYIYAMGREPWLQYGMGLGPSGDTPQDRESRKLLDDVRQRGFLDAQRPFCTFETYLNSGAAAAARAA